MQILSLLVMEKLRHSPAEVEVPHREGRIPTLREEASGESKGHRNKAFPKVTPQLIFCIPGQEFCVVYNLLPKQAFFAIFA